MIYRRKYHVFKCVCVWVRDKKRERGMRDKKREREEREREDSERMR